VNGHNYLDTYREGGIYDDPEYGSPYVSKGVKFARFNRYYLKPESKVVCIGCGNGFEVIEYLNQGHDAYGTEVHPIDVKILKGRIINAAVPNLPFKDKEFDLLHCTEVLEHVPEEETDDFLKECKRVSKKQFFSIATEKDSFNTHININKPGWWIDKFNENKMGIENFQFKPIVSNIYGSYHYEVYYTEGVTVLCRQV
jgi:ubiquinone/menaquinone biosynthesis C-methylase UbiE